MAQISTQQLCWEAGAVLRAQHPPDPAAIPAALQGRLWSLALQEDLAAAAGCTAPHAAAAAKHLQVLSVQGAALRASAGLCLEPKPKGTKLGWHQREAGSDLCKVTTPQEHVSFGATWQHFQRKP